MKKLIKILPVVLVICFVFTFTFADVDWSILEGGTAASTVTKTTGNVYQTIMTVVRVLAVLAVVFAGLRYMFASADQKADIKKSMGILAIGALLVFGATFVLDLINNLSGELTK